MAFTIVLNQVITLFLIMAVGYILTKLSLLSETGVKELTTILLFVVTPAIIIISLQVEVTPQRISMLKLAFFSALSIFIFSIVSSDFVFREKFFANPEHSTVVRFSTVYSNAGFMGLPLVEAVLGQDGLLMGSIFIAVFNFFAWTHGVILYSGYSDLRSMKKSVLNPNIIAIVVGVILFSFAIKLPKPIYSSVHFLSTLNTPLAMIVIGNRIARIRFRELLSGYAIWIAILTRNVIMPLILMIALHFAGVKGALLLGCMIPVACPTAGNTVLFAELFDKDSFFAARLMTLSTLISIVTIPALVYLFTVLSF